MNEFQLNESALEAQAAAVLDEAAALEQGAQAPAEPGAVPDSWAPVVAGCVPLLRIGVFPQWDIQDAEANEFTEALAQCLDQLFPGGMQGKYACFVRLIACCGGIVAARALQPGGIPPLGPKRAESEKRNEAESGHRQAS